MAVLEVGGGGPGSEGYPTWTSYLTVKVRDGWTGGGDRVVRGTLHGHHLQQ